ncbi:hypothetical protein SAMN02745664_103152 [Moraxella cuniculi DSM 21768]|uniref:Uncharacterized protein n=1 Tax=Moraxella cuniculi DSM 21768 TaxID=1122245 RepID=A0A1N7E7R0_9GAMM|nr:hypothetical protein [Moraxella cuniculi]OOS06588.1 hypothetical protein B0189_04455 [Moraxella cuniculi]SIR84035.1 hypothetical protein SAMN02745664_103152 [Moraxella cuniculi DSM 21768]
MRELSLKEIEMVNGGMRQDVGKTTGGSMGGSPMITSMKIGAASSGSVYIGQVASGDTKFSTTDFLISTGSGALGGAISYGGRSPLVSAVKGGLGGGATLGFSKMFTNKTGDDYNNTQK